MRGPPPPSCHPLSLPQCHACSAPRGGFSTLPPIPGSARLGALAPRCSLGGCAREEGRKPPRLPAGLLPACSPGGGETSPAGAICPRKRWATRALRRRARPRPPALRGSPRPSEVTFLFPQKFCRHWAGGGGRWCGGDVTVFTTRSSSLRATRTPPTPSPRSARQDPSAAPQRLQRPGRRPPTPATSTPRQPCQRLPPPPRSSHLPRPRHPATLRRPPRPRVSPARPWAGPGRAGWGRVVREAAEARQDTAPAPASGNGRRDSDRRYRAGRSWGRCPGEAPAPRRRGGSAHGPVLQRAARRPAPARPRREREAAAIPRGVPCLRTPLARGPPRAPRRPRTPRDPRRGRRGVSPTGTPPELAGCSGAGGTPRRPCPARPAAERLLGVQAGQGQRPRHAVSPQAGMGAATRRCLGCCCCQWQSHRARGCPGTAAPSGTGGTLVRVLIVATGGCSLHSPSSVMLLEKAVREIL